MLGDFGSWIELNIYSLLLYGGLLSTVMSVIFMYSSIGSGQRLLAFHEVRIYVRLEIEDKAERLGRWYSSAWGDRLLASMGLPRWLDVARLKITRDVICLIVLILILFRWFIVSEGGLYYPIIATLALFSALSPNEQYPSIFNIFIAPLFQRVHNYRVGRETSVLIQLLRNEVSETQQRNVLSIIRQYQNYFKILREDLLLLEYGWKNRSLALKHFRERYPENAEIELICSVLDKLDEIGYEEAGKTLRENEETLLEKQTASYKTRQKDINQVLALVNISGVAAAALWGILALFMWAYSFDINY
ncbi:hypothetical protein [Paenibacillus sp. GYB003]|uniref:hypothetical protein n=1 Tax=Paenibacillus sp. GYB003 TaxID=2994392 RepID=UPI002F96DCFF